MSRARTVHVVVPDGIDDPLRSSGGNVYDRRVCGALPDHGWSVRTQVVPGAWPRPGESGRRRVAAALAEVPDDGLVLVDGLLASGLPDVMVPAARRVRLVILLHSPLGAGDCCPVEVRRGEHTVLAGAVAVVATSEWSRGWLVASGLDPARVHVAAPGVDPSAVAVGGGHLLCVGAVTRGKGHDLLVAALSQVADRTWRCRCVGPLTVEPGFVAGLGQDLRRARLEGRVLLDGPRTGAALEAAYAGADALVLASRGETYGMVVTEALAHGLPVLATAVGGVPEALGATPDGRVPGLLTPPGDAVALAGSLGAWLDDPELRGRLRRTAADRRAELPGWPATVAAVARVLAEVVA